MATQAHFRAMNTAAWLVSDCAPASLIRDSGFLCLPCPISNRRLRGDPEVMTHRQRIEALQEFGYNEREAAFLTVAALQSGYFLRRQYNRFAGCQHGKAVVQLVKRMAAHRHSRTMVFPHNTGVYHLCSRPLYQALGDANNRNRRRRSPAAIKAKLMALDFVLDDPERTYLFTEREKFDYFASHRKISPDFLPGKVYSSRRSNDETIRYFVNKLPVFLSPAGAGSPPVISFCYVDPGARSLAGFDTFLTLYSGLFRQLDRVRLFYVADTERHFDTAERRVKSFIESLHSDAAGDDYIVGLLEYFRLEHLYETGQFQSLTRDGLIRLKKARRSFRDHDTECLFNLWKRDGDGAVSKRIRNQKPSGVPDRVDFVTYHLEHSYAFLETFSTR